jgi:hypothetical protein
VVIWIDLYGLRGKFVRAAKISFRIRTREKPTRLENFNDKWANARTFSESISNACSHRRKAESRSDAQKRLQAPRSSAKQGLPQWDCELEAAPGVLFLMPIAKAMR